MGFRESLMKLVVKVQDVVELVKRFEASPGTAMRELGEHVRHGAKEVLERVMEAEIALFLGQDAEVRNKRNGYVTRTFVFKGLGAIEVRVPRDRAGRFETKVMPSGRRYDEALEKDLALLHLAGLSTRTLSHVSQRVLGLQVSPQEVSNALATIVPAAKAFLERDLKGRRFKYLWVDGTNFKVRRATVDREPTLVVIGVDESDHKSVLAMVQGDKDARSAWEMVFASMKERGFDGSAVQLGVMDGLPGLAEALLEAFPKARVARCWVHKLRNVMTLVPRRYQAEFKRDWDKVAYASGRIPAEARFAELKQRWEPLAGDAVARFEKDLEALLCHYDFPREHWSALRTTNPIERVNKEFKRRSKSMEQMGSDGLKALLAFTAVRLEFGWSSTPLTSAKLTNLLLAPTRQGHPSTSIDAVTQGLLN
jgi:transposase-like protein